VLVANVERWLARAGRTRCLVGINLGRQPGAPIDRAARDFEQGMRAAWRCADYLAINLSGPANRTLLESRRPTAPDVLQRVREEATRLAAATGRRVPIVVKVPVVADDSAHAAAAARGCREIGFDGLIAAFEGMTGAAAERVLKRLARTLGATTLIAVGGIRTPERARAYLTAGARLVQVYRLYAEAGPLALAALMARCMRG
jgi:dihydroorotate dehydrogenase